MTRQESAWEKYDREYKARENKERHERHLDDASALADWERELLFPGKWYVQHGDLIVGPYRNQRRAERMARNGGVPVCLTPTIIRHLDSWGMQFNFEDPNE